MRIETLLEAKAEADELHNKSMVKSMGEIKTEVKAIRDDLDKHKEEYAALKNKGTGLLVGVALAAGGVGAGIQALFSWVK